MRLLHWDALNPHSIPPGQPYLWDDPNLFFGADGLGYAREPGFAGFVPYLPPTPFPANPHRTSLVQVIQEAPGYNDTLGTDLGIIGSAATAPDLNGVQPEISVENRGPHV